MIRFLDFSGLWEKSKIVCNNFSNSIAEAFQGWQLRIALLSNMILNLSLWLIAFRINQIVSQQLIVLHYNVDFGVNYIGNVKMLYIIPLMSLIIMILNVIVMSFFKKEFYFHYFLISASIVCSLFLHVAIGTIFLINFTQ